MSDFRQFNRDRIEKLLQKHATMIGSGKMKQAHFILVEIVGALLAHAEMSHFTQGAPAFASKKAVLDDEGRNMPGHDESLDESYVRHEPDIYYARLWHIAKPDLRDMDFDVYIQTLIPEDKSVSVTLGVTSQSIRESACRYLYALLTKRFGDVDQIVAQQRGSIDSFVGTALFDGVKKEFQSAGNAVNLLEKSDNDTGPYVCHNGSPSDAEIGEMQRLVDIVNETEPDEKQLAAMDAAEPTIAETVEAVEQTLIQAALAGELAHAVEEISKAVGEKKGQDAEIISDDLPKSANQKDKFTQIMNNVNEFLEEERVEIDEVLKAVDEVVRESTEDEGAKEPEASVLDAEDPEEDTDEDDHPADTEAKGPEKAKPATKAAPKAVKRKPKAD